MAEVAAPPSYQYTALYPFANFACRGVNVSGSYARMCHKAAVVTLSRTASDELTDMRNARV